MTAKKSNSATPKRLLGLWYHPTGGYAKKFKGTTYYFGKDPDTAAKRFAKDWPVIQAGGVPRDVDSKTSVRDLCNRFLTDREARVERGDLSPRSFDDYHRTCKHLVETFGKAASVETLRPEDFGNLRRRLERTRGPVALKNEIGRVRVVFNFAYKNFLISNPVRYGTQLDPPSAKKMRRAIQKRGALLFTSDDLARILRACNPNLRAMVLLGLNGGFGNSDLARLPLETVDVDSSWLDYARVKNAMPRRCPLWPETVDALKVALSERPTPKPEAEGLFFVTRFGGDWAGRSDDVISKEFRKVLNATGLHRPRLGFYSLRRTFRTFADEVGDDRAAGLIMGHADTSMAGRYVQQIADERLKAITEHVRSKVLAAG